jgi:hypothetical protein
MNTATAADETNEAKGETPVFTPMTQKEARLLDLGRRITARGLTGETLDRFAFVVLNAYAGGSYRGRYINRLVNRDFSIVNGR